jgi:hypothetical protein
VATLTTKQNTSLENVYNAQENLRNVSTNYWQQHSNMGTWGFWASIGILILPLVILYFLLDRKKAFRIGFFGFSVHVLFIYTDALGVMLALWNYPYRVLPIMPVHFGLDASLVPVTYMLVYQWIINHNKNPYLYLTGLSLFFAFIFKPLLSAVGLFDLSNGGNYFYLFLAYMIITLLSIWITNFFLYLQKEQGTSPKDEFSTRTLFRKKEKAK